MTRIIWVASAEGPHIESCGPRQEDRTIRHIESTARGNIITIERGRGALARARQAVSDWRAEYGRAGA